MPTRKTCLLLLASALAPICQASAQTTFYYQKGKKVPVTPVPQKKYVLFAPEVNRDEVEQAVKPTGAVLLKFNKQKPIKSIQFSNEAQPPQFNWAIIENKELAANPLDKAPVAEKVVYKAPFFKTKNGNEVGLSHLFYVKLRNQADRPKLDALAKQFKVKVLGPNKFMPLFFTLACDNKSAGNALEVANKFHETEQFSLAEPDFMMNYQLQAVNDQYFGEQWGFENTGQNGGTPGIDIKAIPAWTGTTGSSNVIVAVLDHGFELNHPDLPNVANQSYDTVSGSSPSQVRGNHGTACAGIIGAGLNNSVGVAGIASGCKLMSISNSLTLGPNVQQELADGINWAWQNGAWVISNSWGHNALASSLIDAAIDDALTQGRNGRGTIVVFAAGNDNGPVGYPANSNPGILAVGAASPCGERKSPHSCDPETFWGGNFGPELDVAAPGVLIPTTDRQGTAGYDATNYTHHFNGTSSATPHVAGVAALVLSVNPTLTRNQVADIIESTAQKVGPYHYVTTPGRPNGTWHEEMGYGLVDARAAVQKARAAHSSGVTGGGTIGKPRPTQSRTAGANSPATKPEN
jgi:subtilisin family serine protease